jgi:hypothetical protein
LENPAVAKHLVLRNVDLAAHQSEVVIYDFQCFSAARNPLA